MNKLILLTLLFVLPASAWADQSSDQRLQDVQTEIKDLSNQLDHSKATKEQLYQLLKKQSQAASKLSRELRQLDNSIAEKAKQLATLKQQVKQQNEAHEQQLAALTEQLRAAYRNAQPNYLKVLLNQHDPAKLARSSIYFQYFHQARQQQLTEINQILLSLSDDQRRLYAAQQQQQELQSQRKQQQQNLKTKNTQRLATLKQLDKKIGAQSSRIAQLKQEEQALQAVFESLTIQKKQPQIELKTNKKRPKFSRMKGQLPWPIPGKVVARYGSKRNLGKLTWQGIMIAAPSGKSVQSSAAGQVVFSGWLRGFGLLLIIDHGDKYMTLYGNNQSLFKEVGDTVTAGELIALSGDKGTRQHAGLYFEIRHKGSPTNPIKWLGKQS